MKIIGATIGDPYSAKTYSGVPYAFFQQLDQQGYLAGRVNSMQLCPIDVFSGAIDVRRSMCSMKPKLNRLWRFRPVGIESLSRRLSRRLESMGDIDALFQFGVGALPPKSIRLMAHVEISVKTAMEIDSFSDTYGFSGHSAHQRYDAIKGERIFLDRCEFVWTNSAWTAAQMRLQGVEDNRLLVHPPAPGLADPGVISRDWDPCSILFIGKDWKRKGGPQLLEAFHLVRRKYPDASLTIIGCSPPITDHTGVRVLGFLNVRNSVDRKRLEQELTDANIFCMPSIWESTGIVYMEAALFGLPSIMLKGQGREHLFPPGTALYVEKQLPVDIAEAILTLQEDSDLKRHLGENARVHVTSNYMWENLMQKLIYRF